jgi:PAS domain S-box-containing protein
VIFSRSAARPPSAPRVLPATLSWILLAYAAALCLGLWAHALWRIESDRSATLAAEHNRLRAVSLALEAEVEAMSNDGVGAAVAAASELSDGPSSRGSSGVATVLGNMLTGGQYVRALFLVDAAQFVEVGRDYPMPLVSEPPSWLRSAFGVRTGDSWVGAPVHSPDGSTRVLVPMAQRVHRGADSVWAGALIGLEGLDRMYRGFSPSGGIGIYTLDGVPLLITPTTDPPLRPFARPVNSGVGDTEIYRRVMRGPPTGVIEGISPYYGTLTIVAYARLPSFPLIVATAHDRDLVLAPWEARRRDTLLLTGGVTVLVLATTGLLVHFIGALRRRERHYRTLFNNAGFGAFILWGGRVVEANRTSAEMFGVRDPQQLLGMTPSDVSPARQPDGGESSEHVRERIRTALEKGTARFEWLHKRLNTGEPFWANVDLTSLEADGKALTLAVIHDETERKQLDAAREQALSELRELAGALVHAQDDERRHIGRELHDTTGQSLAALELNLERWGRSSRTLDDKARDELGQCVDLAHRCSTEIRTAAYLLHPPLLDEIGLLSALRWLADGLRQRSHMEIALELPAAMARLPREQELALFRVAQEALTNVHRHALSPTATIRVREDSEQIVMEVADTGRGILAGGDGPLVGTTLGVGLAGMRERMRQLGGTLTVLTSPHGTTVRAELAPVYGAGGPLS